MRAITQVETSSERAVTVFRANGGILHTRRAMKLGIHPRTIYALRDDAKLERMERGLIALPMRPRWETRTL